MNKACCHHLFISSSFLKIKIRIIVILLQFFLSYLVSKAMHVFFQILKSYENVWPRNSVLHNPNFQKYAIVCLVHIV